MVLMKYLLSNFSIKFFTKIIKFYKFIVILPVYKPIQGKSDRHRKNTKFHNGINDLQNFLRLTLFILAIK